MSVSSFTPALWQGRSNPSLVFAVGVVPQPLPCTPSRRQYQSSQRFPLQTYNPNENTPHGIKTLFKSSSGPFSTEIVEMPVNGPSRYLAGDLHRLFSGDQAPQSSSCLTFQLG